MKFGVILTYFEKFGTFNIENLNLVFTKFCDLSSGVLFGNKVVLGPLLEENVEVSKPTTFLQLDNIDPYLLALLVGMGTNQHRATLHNEEQIIELVTFFDYGIIIVVDYRVK